jgi:hypothetical protein
VHHRTEAAYPDASEAMLAPPRTLPLSRLAARCPRLLNGQCGKRRRGEERSRGEVEKEKERRRRREEKKNAYKKKNKFQGGTCYRRKRRDGTGEGN